MNNTLLNVTSAMMLASVAMPVVANNAVHQDKRPNIILFLVDDMGWQDTSVPFWTERLIIIRYSKRQTWSDWQAKV